MNASTWNAYTTAQRVAVVTNSKDQRFAYVNGQLIGQTDLAGAKLDATTRLTAYSSSDVGAGSVTVQDGDTLKSIAQRVYGEESLWYVLADANAIDDDSQLVAGTELKAPQVTTHQNDANTFKPYDPNQVIGPTTPSLPYVAPPPKQHCNTLATILVIVVVVIVTVYTAGAAAGAAAPGRRRGTRGARRDLPPHARDREGSRPRPARLQFPPDPGGSAGRCHPQRRAGAGHGRQPRQPGSGQGLRFHRLGHPAPRRTGLLARWRPAQAHHSSRRRVVKPQVQKPLTLTLAARPAPQAGEGTVRCRMTLCCRAGTDGPLSPWERAGVRGKHARLCFQTNVRHRMPCLRRRLADVGMYLGDEKHAYPLGKPCVKAWHPESGRRLQCCNIGAGDLAFSQ